jgi:hypothetical protein
VPLRIRIFDAVAYLGPCPNLVRPCIPSRGTKVPRPPEVDPRDQTRRYRLIVQRDGKRVRLWTRNAFECEVLE